MKAPALAITAFALGVGLTKITDSTATALPNPTEPEGVWLVAGNAPMYCRLDNAASEVYAKCFPAVVENRGQTFSGE